MAKTRKKPLGIMDTTLRDGHQCLLATRMRMDDMVPILEKMDSVGFAALEVWGGATFDATHRFLNEDPWERLATFKRYCPNTPLQMLLRGQNLVGYRHYADDVVEAVGYTGRDRPPVARCARLGARFGHGIPVTEQHRVEHPREFVGLGSRDFAQSGHEIPLRFWGTDQVESTAW